MDNVSTTLILNGIISGAGSLTKAGPGTLSLSGNNTYTGGTTLIGGILAFADGGLGSNGDIAFANPGSGATLVYAPGNTQDISARLKNSTAQIVIDNNGQWVTFGSAIDNTNTDGLLIKNSAANYSAGNGSPGVILSGFNTFAGGLTIGAGAAAGGSVDWSNDNQLGAAGGSIILDNGDLKATDGTHVIAASRTITVTVNGGYIQQGYPTATNNTTVAAKITGAGFVGINFDGPGTVTFSNSGNDYAGDTRIGTEGPAYWLGGNASATLRLGADNVIPSGAGAGNVVVGYAYTGYPCTLDLHGYNASINGLTTNLTGNETIYAIVDNLSSVPSTLTVGNNDATSTFAGQIRSTSGVLALIKVGSGR